METSLSRTSIDHSASSAWHGQEAPRAFERQLRPSGRERGCRRVGARPAVDDQQRAAFGAERHADKRRRVHPFRRKALDLAGAGLPSARWRRRAPSEAGTLAARPLRWPARRGLARRCGGARAAASSSSPATTASGCGTNLRKSSATPRMSSAARTPRSLAKSLAMRAVKAASSRPVSRDAGQGPHESTWPPGAANCSSFSSTPSRARRCPARRSPGSRRACRRGSSRCRPGRIRSAARRTR